MTLQSICTSMMIRSSVCSNLQLTRQLLCPQTEEQRPKLLSGTAATSHVSDVLHRTSANSGYSSAPHELCKSTNQWIGLRENLQETMVFTIKWGFPVIFPLNQSIEPIITNPHCQESSQKNGFFSGCSWPPAAMTRTSFGRSSIASERDVWMEDILDQLTGGKHPTITIGYRAY